MTTFANATAPVWLEVDVRAGIWAGDVAPTQFYDSINFTKLTLTPPKQDPVRVFSNIKGSVGDVLGSQYKVGDPAKLTGEMNSFNKMLALIIMGADDSAVTQTGAALTAQVVTTVLDMWVPLPHKYLASTGFSLTTASDVAVTSDKYAVDTTLGMIKAIHADAVGVGMKASYTTTTVAGTKFGAGKAKVTSLMLLGSAIDKQTNTKGEIIIPKVNVASNQEWDLASEEFMTGMFEGDLIIPTGYTSPWSFMPFTET
jgi:hypothetical protein